MGREKCPKGKGIRPAREGEEFCRSDEDGDTAEFTHTRSRARARAQTLSHTEPQRATQPLDSHHELLEKSIEYKKSPMVRQASRSPLLSFSHIFLPLSLSPSLLLCLPPVHYPPCLSRALALARSRVRARARAREISVWVRSCRGGGESRVCTLAIDGDRRYMRARTTAKDGDKYAKWWWKG